MRKMLFVALAVMCIMFSVSSEVRSASLDGDPGYVLQDYWRPINPCVTFYYANDHVDGVEVEFKIQEGGTKLFRNWLVRLNDGTATFFPFILEVTLILNDGNAFADPAHAVDQYARGTRGVYWDFGMEGQCIEYPNAYLDTHLSDTSFSKFGIGILKPYQLQEGKTYKFWIKLTQYIDNISNVTAQLRFRLNIDVGKCYELDYYPGDNFELGGGWQASYYGVPYANPEPDPQTIAECFSFAVTQFKSSDPDYGKPSNVYNLSNPAPIINTHCN